MIFQLRRPKAFVRIPIHILEKDIINATSVGHHSIEVTILSIIQEDIAEKNLINAASAHLRHPNQLH